MGDILKVWHPAISPDITPLPPHLLIVSGGLGRPGMISVVLIAMADPRLTSYHHAAAANLARRKEVIVIEISVVVTLVLGTATLVVAVIGLVVKIIELTRH